MKIALANMIMANIYETMKLLKFISLRALHLAWELFRVSLPLDLIDHHTYFNHIQPYYAFGTPDDIGIAAVLSLGFTGASLGAISIMIS